MTPDEEARAHAEIRASLAEIRARLAELKAQEPKRLRRQIKIELALERMHQANAALRAALPR
jgi:hypothetical protein